MFATSARTRVAAGVVGAFVLIGLVACGSSSGDSSSTTAPSGASSGSADGGSAGDEAADDGTEVAATDVDPCQWYTAEEMSALVGFEVTMEEVETPQALGVECLYNSDAEYTGITVRPTTAADYDQLKATAAQMDIGGEQVDVSGIGDEAYHNGVAGNPNPSVALSAKQGDAAIEVELAAASGGTIASADQGIEIVSAIATKALG